jgi:type I restriction enzyme, S subunit
MVVENGYKNTEIGIIPEDWHVNALKNVCLYRRGSFPQPYGLAKWYDEINGAPFVQVFDIDNNWKIKPQTKRYISKLAQELSIFAPKETILLTIQGSIGRIAITQYDAYVDRTLLIFESFKIVFDKKYFCLAIETLFEREKKNAPGGIIKTITKEALSVFEIPIPPLPEQTAIATALSDMDELIAQTSTLIEKKKAIKQGVIQELLRPKKGWVTKKLGEVAVFRRGSFPQPYGLDKWYDDINGEPFVQVFDVDNDKKLKPETKRYISVDAQKMSVFAKKGTIVLTIQGSIGRIAITQYDAFIDRTLLVFESFKYEFNDYFFMHTIHQLFEIEKQSAPGGIIKTITKNALKNFEITFPEIDEQVRIGMIIKDIESDIVTMENKLQKLNNKKQGMMQALLTGKIRLV